MNHKRASLLVLLVLLFLLSLLLGCSPQAPPTEAQKDPGIFTMTFLTIGKGDAFLLETPQQQAYLIDTGKAQDYIHIARALRVLNVDHLDGIFLTHGHRDHAGGLSTLLQAFPTETVYYWEEDQTSYDSILPQEIVPRFHTQLISPKCGEILDLGGITAEVWLPERPDLKNGNNNSMVLMLQHGSNKFLMMGDAELREEAQLMQSSMDLQADVLKLGHHGETDATSPAFLQRVQPKIGLIAGNQEENPDSLNKEISDLLKGSGVRALYSESNGLGIRLISDGREISLQELPDREFPETLQVRFSQVNRQEQWLTLCNEGAETADLGGCLIRSVKHDELYLIPEGTRLAPGQMLTIACRDSAMQADLIWDADSVWQGEKDEARLYDQNLNKLHWDRPGK